jgi:hypothetical protein
MVARGVERPAGQDLAVIGDLDLHPADRPAHRAELEFGGRVAGERPGGFCHAVHVEDLHAQPGEEVGHVRGQRGGGAGDRPGLAEAEQAADRPEHLLVGRKELGRQFR